MPRPKPDKLKRIAQEDAALEMSAKGWTTRRIGAAMGISHTHVRRILDRVHSRELKRLGEKYENLRIQTANEHDHIKQEMSDGWEKSKQPKHVVRQTVDAEGREVTVTSVEERVGDLSFVDRWLATLRDKARVMGLNVADKANDDGPFTLASLMMEVQARGKAYDAEIAADEEAKKAKAGLEPGASVPPPV